MNSQMAGRANNRTLHYIVVRQPDQGPTIYYCLHKISFNDIPEAPRNKIQQSLVEIPKESEGIEIPKESEGVEIPAPSSLPTEDLSSPFDTFLPTYDSFLDDQEIGMGDFDSPTDDLYPPIFLF